ncbi:MAG: flagellar export protein FliJ [Pseudomonadota bacterium]|nr:flagellar export protein FliJ [Pseudomonadota bacterium]
MASRFPLQSLLDHSRHRMEAAERLLRMLKRKEEAARRRRDELHGYKQDYQLRLTGEAGSQGMAIHLLRDYHAFLSKLELAIRHQESEVAQAVAHWQSAHDNWLTLRQKVKAYEALADRHRHQERQREEKRDQRITDEQAARRHVPKSAL